MNTYKEEHVDPEIKNERQVYNELERIEELLAVVEKEFESLMKSIEPVADYSNGYTTPEYPEEYLVPVAKRLHQVTMRLDTLYVKLSYLNRTIRI